MPDQLCRWKSMPTEDDGIIVGCSSNHEYLLPWWWNNYQNFNEYPVTFFDFGDLSPNAREWCRERGNLVTLPSIAQYIAPKEKIDPKHIASWESHMDFDPWKARQEWFKKPLACLQSPYKRTIWFDLDCQILDSVTPIFDMCEPDTFAIAEEPALVRLVHERDGFIPPDAMEYNTGVIGYYHSVPLMETWARKCLEANNNYRGDEEALAALLHEQQLHPKVLPPRFNWRGDIPTNEGFMDFLVVIHWLGSCKQIIRAQIEEMAKADQN